LLPKDLEEVSSVRGVPTFRFYKDGNKVAEVVGANIDKVKEGIQSHK
jgi:thiol-disulfide isomerase/thioredoxin